MSMECTHCHNPLIEDAAYCPKCGTRQLGAPSYDDKRYAAFISYRHQPLDSKFAKKLQRAIESYRLPKNIATANGSRKLGRVFRDEDELSAAVSLPQAIQDALKQSDALIVVCSPTTKDSEWVRQEIAAFASYHGRDRIFAALIDGGSASGLPDALRQRTVVGEDGSVGEIPAQPLAADFRNRSNRNFTREKLRIFAALAQCDYDDLARRNLARTRKTTAACAFAAVAAIAVAGITALQISSIQRSADLGEATRLATLSIEDHKNGKGIEAKREALEALDLAKRAGGYELVPEAERALELTSDVYTSADSPWMPGNSETIAGPIDALAVSIDGELYAAVGSNLNAVVYTTLTDSPCASFPLPLGDEKDGDRTPDNWKLALDENYLIASNPSLSGSGITSCFNVITGEECWRKNLYMDTLCFPYKDEPGVSHSEGLFATYIPLGQCLWFGGMQAEKGNAGYLPCAIKLNGTSSSNPRIIGACESAQRGAFAAGSTIAVIDTNGYTALSADAPRSAVSSMKWCDGKLIVASYDSEQALDNDLISYTINAYTSSLDLLWSTSGDYSVAASVLASTDFALDNSPSIAHCSPDADSAKALVSAGTDVYEISIADGSLSKIYEASNPICALNDGIYLQGNHIACITDSSGKVTPFLIDSERNVSAYTDYAFTLPTPCSAVHTGSCNRFGFQVIATSAAEKGRIYAYRSYLGGHSDVDAQEPDMALEGESIAFAPTSDGSYLIGSPQQSNFSFYELYDGNSFELLDTIDAAKITGLDSENGEELLTYDNRSNPDIMYFSASRVGEESTLFAYSFKEQDITGSTPVLHYPIKDSSIPSFVQFCEYATPHGIHLMRLDTSQGSLRGFSLARLDPATLETLSETPSPDDLAPFAAWALEGRTLIAHVPRSNTASIDGQLSLIEENTGIPISSDLDNYQPYSTQGEGVSSIAVNDSATRVAVACNDDMLRCFELPSGSLLWEHPFSGRASRSLMFSRDECPIFAQDEKGSCYFIDADSGEIIGHTDTRLSQIENAAYRRFTQDGTGLIASYRPQGAIAPTTCILAPDANGELKLSSELASVFAISADESGVLIAESPNRLVRKTHFTIENLYSWVEYFVGIDLSVPVTLIDDESESADSSPGSSQSSSSPKRIYGAISTPSTGQ